MSNTTKFIRSILIFVLLFVMNVAVANAQTTEFTYQGTLNSSGTTANGNFDFEFALFDAASGGAQLGTTQTKSSVAVVNGTFSVNLNFGGQFPGAGRFLEIRVRQTGGGGFTTLAPRNPVNSSPYSVKSLSAETATTATNATQLGGVASIQFVLTTDPRMTNSRPPTPGNNGYIQNSSTVQTSTNFNIDGVGKANILDASQFNSFGRSILSPRGTNNLFAGILAGENNTSGQDNAFFGGRAGTNNRQGSENSFFGAWAGERNMTGYNNSFFGSSAGLKIESGNNNSFFGRQAGVDQTGGRMNSYFGSGAGTAFISGDNNTFIGGFAGWYTAGVSGSGNRLTLIGAGATVTADALEYATALGAGSKANFSNTVVLGRSADTVTIPGTATIGIDIQRYAQLNINAPSSNANFFMAGDGASRGINFGVDSTTTTLFAKLFISQYDGVNYVDRLTVNENGTIGINTLGQGGATSLCRNSSNQISNCSSSARYKSKIKAYTPGLSLIRKLRPVSFNWTEGGMPDIGLVAEDVAEVESLLTSTNDKGEVEGVKYDRVGVVLINAVNEQQAQIEGQQKLIETQQKQFEAQQELNKTQQNQLEAQQKLIEVQQEQLEEQQQSNKAQQQQIDELKQIVCQSNPSASICKP